MFYRTMRPQYRSAEDLSLVKYVSDRRLNSKFGTRCHCLLVDTDRWADGVHPDRTERLNFL